MTRINADIPVDTLCDQHLLAEHREIVRLVHLVDSKSEPPPTFRLGSGHVLWFKYRLKFAHNRYQQLYRECIRRGFKVSYMGSNFKDIPDKHFQDWSPTPKDNQIIRERIVERLGGMKKINYLSQRIDFEQAKNLL